MVEQNKIEFTVLWEIIYSELKKEFPNTSFSHITKEQYMNICVPIIEHHGLTMKDFLINLDRHANESMREDRRRRKKLRKQRKVLKNTE